MHRPDRGPMLLSVAGCTVVVAIGIAVVVGTIWRAAYALFMR